MRIVIIGNGIAATSAAAAIREIDRKSPVTMISDENVPFYSRPRLIEYLAGRAEFEKIVIRDSSWYEKNGIELVRGANVQTISMERREVAGGFGAVCYDALLIASGASPALPSFCAPGIENVFTLRTKDNADAIIAAMAKAHSAMVIGGGLLGIETANALTERGLESTIIEFFDRLLPRQLDAEAAAILQGILEAKGLRILLGKKTESLSNPKGRTEARFADGATMRADVTIISAGVKPNTAFLQGTGIALNRGIIVDRRMRTNVPGIFAAGDCAEFEGKMYGIWPAAKEQGALAGEAIAGKEVAYTGSLMSTKLKVVGIDLASLGDISENPLTRTESRREGSSFRKLFYEGERLKGAILIGAAAADYFTLQKEMALQAPR